MDWDGWSISYDPSQDLTFRQPTCDYMQNILLHRLILATFLHQSLSKVLDLTTVGSEYHNYVPNAPACTFTTILDSLKYFLSPNWLQLGPIISTVMEAQSPAFTNSPKPNYSPFFTPLLSRHHSLVYLSNTTHRHTVTLSLSPNFSQYPSEQKDYSIHIL